MLMMWSLLLLLLHGAATRGPLPASPTCSWEQMSATLVRLEAGVCEYTGNIAIRVLPDSVVFIAFADCAMPNAKGLCMIRVETSASSLPAGWERKVHAGFLRVQDRK